jgi:GNAT superfamily N-acetyltransferase
MLDAVTETEVKYAVESYADVVEDIKAHMAENWEEIGTYKDIPLDPDFNYFEMIDKYNILVIHTARNEDGDLIGYAIFTITPNVLYKSHKWALNGPIWIHPDYRSKGVGRGFVAFWNEDLKKRGADVIRITVEVAHPTMAYLLNDCGYNPVEASYELRIS